MPANLNLVYRDFSKGHFGTLGIFAAPEGTFFGKNVIRSREGVLHPRPGTEVYPTAGSSVGEVHALGWNGVAGRDVWVLINQTVFHRDGASLASGWTAATGTITAEPNEQCPFWEVRPGITYILVPGQGLWKLDLTSAPGALTQVAAVTADMAGRALAVWGERLFIGGWDPGRRVYYSEPGDFETWPAANFFDVGPASQVRVLIAQRQHLAVALQDGSWYVMTGSTPATGTIRSVIGPQGTWHFWTNSAVRTNDDMIWMVPNQGTWPAAFDGSQVAELRHLEYAPTQGNIAGEQNVVAGRMRDEVLFISGEPSSRGEAIFLTNGTWTKHSIGGDIAGGVVSDGQKYIYLHDFGGPAVAPHVYRLDVQNNGDPGGVVGALGDESSTDPLDAEVHLPGFWSEDGQEVCVRQIIVDGWKWDTGAATDNTLDAAIHTYGQTHLDGPQVHSLDAWTEAASSSPAGGERVRWIWNIGPRWNGGGFQVRFPALTGVGIEQVIVKVERAASLPRA